MTVSDKKYVYTIQDLTKIYPGGKKIIENLYLSFLPGAKIGVLGPNGAGKSTLLRIIAGIDKDFVGSAFAANGIEVGYLPQEPKLNNSKNVFDNIKEGLANICNLLEEFENISACFADPDQQDNFDALINKQAELQEKIDAVDGWSLERRIEIAMDALLCPPKDSPVTNLSIGERRRVALARLLLSQPDILLLDEPTNHLDVSSIWWLEQFLADYQGTVIAVTHDRYFLDNVTGWILEMDRGKGMPYEGNYTSWLDYKQKRMLDEGRQDASRKKIIEKELEWIRSNAKGRRKKQKSRIVAFDNLMAEHNVVKSDGVQISIPTPERLGDIVIDFNNVEKAFGERILFSNLSFKIPKGAIVGIIGPNGAGKSTMLKLMAKIEQPDKGDVVFGDTVTLGYVSQSRETLNDNNSVWQEVSDGLDEIVLNKNKSISTRAYVASFNFKGRDQEKKLKDLSGGERNRLHLAKVLKTRANVIFLDEPTNDLDVETFRALEDALLGFPGSIVVVSHDRWFLDRIATHIIAFEENNSVVWFDGTFSEYEDDKKSRSGEEDNRFKYKRIIR